MNGGILGKANSGSVGVWNINDVVVNRLLRYPIPSGATIIDDYSSISGRVNELSAIHSLNTSVFYTGDSALNVYKNATHAYATVYKDSLTPRNVSGKRLGVFVYFKDESVVSKLVKMHFSFGTGTGAYKTYDATKTRFDFSFSAWNNFEWNEADNDAIYGSPNMGAVDYVKVWLVTGASGDLLSAGDVVVDCAYYR